MSNLPKPLVTIVVPCHNYEKYLPFAIQSIQNQTLTNWECFIVNDASDDNSELVAMEAIKGDLRFQVLSVNNHNLSATRNDGIVAGSGIYICLVDADDMIGNENYLEVLVSELEKDRTLGIAYSSITIMDSEGKLGSKPNWPPDEFDAEGQYAHINQIPSMCVFRREMWERCGGFIRHFVYAQDADFWTTAIDIGYGAKHVIKDGWFHYRIHNKSQSQGHRDGSVPEPDWLEWHPWAISKDRPLAAGGRPPRGSWPVRFYNEPDVSVIIPVGIGHEEAVKDALHSLEGQTHRFWECVVVNDTGHDLALENGFSWAKVVPSVWRGKTTGTLYNSGAGAGAARNLGASYAQADYLVFLDADDMLKPTFLADTLAAYKQHGKYIYTDWLTHEKQTNWQVHETRDYSYEAVAEKPSLHPITCLIPRYWFEAVGGFDETLPAFEDVDLFMKFFVRGYCGMRVKKPLLIYNLDSGKRRKASVDYEPTFKNLLKKRYGAYMEAHNMCDCVQPPKGKQPVAPTMENAAEYKEAYGDIVLAKLVGQFVAEAPVTFRGPATRVLYGRRAKGDVFYIWQADLENSGDTFEKVENYSVEPVPTVVPDAPPVFEPLPPVDTTVERVSEPIAEVPTVDDVPEVVPMSQQVSTPKARGRKPKAK